MPGPVLDELLAARPDLRELAEAYAAQVMTDADRAAVADDVEDALQGLGIEELNNRAGYRPGRGYVHPAEAADEILDEALQPFLDDLQRGADLGTRSAAGQRRRLTMAGRCERRPAGLPGGRHEDQPWPIRTTNGSARARR